MIDFEKHWHVVVDFFTQNIFVAFVLAVAILVFCYKKPEQAVKFFGFCALLVAVLYIMSLLTESGTTGSSNKGYLKSKSESALELK